MMKQKFFTLLIVLSLLLAGCAPSNVQISHGTFENGRYTSNIANFTCDFGTSLEGDSPYTLSDAQDESGIGSLSLVNDFGFMHRVEHVAMSNLNPDIKVLLEDPATYSNGLQMLQDFLIQAHGNAKVLNSYYLTEQRMRVVLLDVPQGSFLVNQTENVRLDAMRAYYIFATDDQVYYVSYLFSITPGFGSPNEQGILQGVDDLYKKCTFGS
jgi:hypothetical protein